MRVNGITYEVLSWAQVTYNKKLTPPDFDEARIHSYDIHW